MLRLLVQGELLTDLEAALASAGATRLTEELAGLRCHRLLDNAPLSLAAPEVWTMLNLQLIHLVDFLPVAAWQRTSGDYFYQIFAQLHRLLHGAGQLQARVAFEECPLSSPQPDAPGCRPKSWSHSLVDMLPPPLVLRLASKSIEGYSREVGHSLGYELRWQGQGSSESPAPAAPSGRWGAVPVLPTAAVHGISKL